MCPGASDAEGRRSRKRAREGYDDDEQPGHRSSDRHRQSSLKGAKARGDMSERDRDTPSGSAGRDLREPSPTPALLSYYDMNEDRLKLGRPKANSEGTLRLMAEIPRVSKIALRRHYDLRDSQEYKDFLQTPAVHATLSLRKWAGSAAVSPAFPSFDSVSKVSVWIQDAFTDHVKKLEKTGRLGGAPVDEYTRVWESLKLLCAELADLFSIEAFWRFACMYDVRQVRGAGRPQRKRGADKSQKPSGGDSEPQEGSEPAHEAENRREKEDTPELDANLCDLITSIQATFEIYEKQDVYYDLREHQLTIVEDKAAADDHHCPGFPDFCGPILAYIRANWSDDIYFWLSEAVLRYVFFREGGTGEDRADPAIQSKVHVYGTSKPAKELRTHIANVPDDVKITSEDREPWRRYYEVRRNMWERPEGGPVVTMFSHVIGSRRHNRLSELGFNEVSRDSLVLPLFALYAIAMIPCMAMGLSPAFSSRMQYTVQELLIEETATHLFSQDVWDTQIHVQTRISLFPAWVADWGDQETDERPAVRVPISPFSLEIKRVAPRARGAGK